MALTALEIPAVVMVAMDCAGLAVLVVLTMFTLSTVVGVEFAELTVSVTTLAGWSMSIAVGPSSSDDGSDSGTVDGATGDVTSDEGVMSTTDVGGV